MKSEKREVILRHLKYATIVTRSNGCEVARRERDDDSKERKRRTSLIEGHKSESERSFSPVSVCIVTRYER